MIIENTTEKSDVPVQTDPSQIPEITSATATEPEEYEEVFGEIPVKEDIADTEIYLNKNVKVIERKNFFMIYIKKSMFYVVPKEPLTQEEIEIMNLHFQKQLDKNFICEASK